MSEEDSQAEPQENNGGETEIDLTYTQLFIMSITALILIYFSAGLATYLQQAPQNRRLRSILLPFVSQGPSGTVLHKRAVKHYRNGNYRKASELFVRSIERNRSNAKGIFLLAGAQAKLGQFDRSLELLETAEKIDPKLSRIFVKKAYLLLGLQQYRRAMENARRYTNRESVPVSNKFYGYLIQHEALKALNKPSELNEVKENLSQLVKRMSDWQSQLYEDILLDARPQGEVSETLNRGQLTELRAWRAIRYRTLGELRQAREAMNWVIKNGDQTRYEYEMMLAMDQRFRN